MRRDSSSRPASRKSASRKTRGAYARQLGYEGLEDRRLLAVNSTFVAATGILTINMPAAGDNADLTLLAGNYKINGAGSYCGWSDRASRPQKDRCDGRCRAQALTITANVALQLGMDVADGLVETLDIKGTVAAGAAINVGTIANPTAVTLENDLGTSGADITIRGAVTLVGGARHILTNGNVGANAGNVTLLTVNGATAGQSLIIDARAATGFNGGAIAFKNIGGTTAATALLSFEAHTNTATGIINFKEGDSIQTDGGAVILEADTLQLADVVLLVDTIDTEIGADNAGGAVDLSAIRDITYTGATIPHILRIDTSGSTTTPAANVLLNTTQFVQGTPSGGFNTFNDVTNNRVQIQVPIVTNYSQDFTSPTAFNDFASNFFTQSGTNFVASPAKGKKAIAVILPAKITPPLPSNFKISTTATVTPPSGAKYSNGYIVFDAVDDKNFKFAGVFAGRKQFSVGEVKKGKVNHKNTSPIAAGSTFNLSVAINAATGNATLSNNGAGCGWIHF